MKKMYTCIALCTIISLALYSCKKEDLKPGLPVREVASAVKPGSTATQAAQSVMYDIAFGFPAGDGSLTPVEFTIAAESFVLNKTFPDKGVYSFSLLNSKGASRISNFQYSFNNGPWMPLPYTIISGCNDAGVLNTFFWANQFFGTAQSYLQDGIIGDILAGDDDPNNNGACGNVDIARASVPLPLKAGAFFNIKVKGVLKGDHIFNDLGFIIDTCSCSEPPLQQN